MRGAGRTPLGMLQSTGTMRLSMEVVLLIMLLIISPLAQAECIPIDLGQTALAARRDLNDQEPEQALARIQAAEHQLPCLDKLATKDALASFYRVGGTAALSVGRQEEAQRLFSAAAVTASEVEFDPTLGPFAMSSYEAELEIVYSLPAASVQTYETVRIDGWELVAGQTLQILPGTHLIQQVLPNGSVSSRMISISSGDHETFGTPPPPPPPPCEVCPDCPVTTTRPTYPRRIGATVAGGALVTLGAAMLAADVYWASNISQYSKQDAPTSSINLLLFGGVAATGVGSTLLVGAHVIPTSNQSINVGLHGQF